MEMEEKQTAAVITVWFGLIALVVSMGADLVGLGNGSDFGLYQVLGLALGIAAILVGALLTFKC